MCANGTDFFFAPATELAAPVRTQVLRSLEQWFFEYNLLPTPTTATVAFGAEGPLPEQARPWHRGWPTV